ncbi:uncharacterized protein METZ01_LOCUS454039 [marine metagenome]|uniref:Uncharacterized protein n=1 Tax=marine metagenome TaxID=408172 RepID=A0A383A1V9_9ZZZZ
MTFSFNLANYLGLLGISGDYNDQLPPQI